MELYLIRHGIAADREAYERDRDRPLTEEGRKKTQKVAKRLRSLDLNFDLILTSPLIRARQTAEILLSQHLAPLLQESEHLAPEGELQAWLAWLNSQYRPQATAPRPRLPPAQLRRLDRNPGVGNPQRRDRRKKSRSHRP
uniref:Phosphohistidine phosphatase SixA n=1 Tax=Desertifilum tharense IPPAS B-1220 TaxID=1781255 RepID=A0ACD5GP52_9CYAN